MAGKIALHRRHSATGEHIYIEDREYQALLLIAVFFQKPVHAIKLRLVQ